MIVMLVATLLASCLRPGTNPSCAAFIYTVLCSIINKIIGATEPRNERELFMHIGPHLTHAMVAFFMPWMWAVILYPFFRIYHKDWRKMLVLAFGFSFAVIVVKERLDFYLAGEDVVSGFLGLFLGTAGVAAIFIVAGARLSKESLATVRRNSLRGLLMLAIRIEEQARCFYMNAAQIFTDTRAKELAVALALEEDKHADLIRAILDRWLPKAPHPDLVTWVEQELARHDIFAHGPQPGAPVEEVLQYAIGQEVKMAAFYMSFKDAFPIEWKRRYVQFLIDQEHMHEKKLTVLAQRLFALAEKVQPLPPPGEQA